MVHGFPSDIELMFDFFEFLRPSVPVLSIVMISKKNLGHNTGHWGIPDQTNAFHRLIRLLVRGGQHSYERYTATLRGA